MIILLPFLLAALMLLLKQNKRFHLGWIALPLPAALFIYFLTRIPAIRAGEPIVNSITWMPSFGVNISLVLDGLSLLFVLLITGMGALVVLYSIYYLDKLMEESASFIYTCSCSWEPC